MQVTLRVYYQGYTHCTDAHQLIRCITHGIQIPPALIILSRKLESHEDADTQPLNVILSIMARFCNFRSSIQTGSLAPRAVVARCQTVERQLVAWRLSCPAPEPGTIMKSYSSVCIAWNVYRILRILTNGLILEHLKTHTAEVQVKRHNCLTNVIDMSSEICAVAESQINRLTHPRVCDVLTLVWPLTVAAIAQQRNQDGEPAALKQLELIGRTCGIHHCFTVVNAIRSTEQESASAFAHRRQAFGCLQTQQKPGGIVRFSPNAILRPIDKNAIA